MVFWFLQDFQDPDYDYLREVQSPRPQLTNNYLSNYNGVEEPYRVTSPSGTFISIGEPHTLLAPIPSPQAPETPLPSPQAPETPRLYPEPGYSIAERSVSQHQPIYQERASLKDPARHFDKYFSEPVDLGYPDEPVNCPAPDEQDISVKVYQPDDVVVRPSSPAIDYSFRGGLDPGVGGIGK